MAVETSPLGVFEKSLSEAVAFAAGVAIAPLLAPYLQELKNVTWAGTPSMPLDPRDLAEAVAQGEVNLATAAKEAKMSGFADTPFGLLAKIADAGPDLGTAFNLWRRGHITDEGFAAAVKKTKIEDRWLPALQKLKTSILSPGEIAAAIHRGLIPDPGLLKGEQPSGKRNVESYPVYPVQTLDEAAGHGFDRDRLGVLVGLQGLPMGPHEAAQAYFRGIITHGDYIAAFNESNNRNEWAQAVLEQTRQIPTARDFFENALRGYHALPWAQEQAKRHGMSDEDSLVIYQNQGRPMNIRLITQALARGGQFNPEEGEIADPYRASVVEGNLKPGYYDLALSLKYTMPSAFAIRQLVQSHVWTAEKGAERLKWSGWYPPDADEVAAAWAKPSGAAAADYVAKAKTRLLTTTHNSYIAAEIDDVGALSHMADADVPQGQRDAVLAVWQSERELARQQMTPSVIVRGYKHSAINNATGAVWTKEEAIEALEKRGFKRDEADNFINAMVA